MSIWEKIQINKDGTQVDAISPIIISASRSTDIPAFYSEWFIERINAGYCKWSNPFNSVDNYISFKNARCFVFWTKNPKPMLAHIDFLNENIKNYYFQFTLNDYEKEGYEPNLPNLNKRIETFKELSDKIGNDRVIWRFDPLILTDKTSIDNLLSRIEKIGDQLHGYTKKLVFSFADIDEYVRVKYNLDMANVTYRDFTENAKYEFSSKLSMLNSKWNYELATCSENIDLVQYGIKKNRCIDDELMYRLFKHDSKLMDFLGIRTGVDIFSGERGMLKTKNMKDSGQRLNCGCVASKDIGKYNTCPHGCVYCYANSSEKSATKNYKKHNSKGDSI